MTPNPLAPRFGRAGGPATQQVREFGDITVSSVAWDAPEGGFGGSVTTKTVLGDPSGITGIAGSYFLIWGYSITTNHTTSGAFGFLEDSAGGENITPYAVMAQGPMMSSFSLPIRLDADKGVRLKSYGSWSTAGKYLLGSVQFTVHAP